MTLVRSASPPRLKSSPAIGNTCNDRPGPGVALRKRFWHGPRAFQVEVKRPFMRPSSTFSGRRAGFFPVSSIQIEVEATMTYIVGDRRLRRARDSLWHLGDEFGAGRRCR